MKHYNSIKKPSLIRYTIQLLLVPLVLLQILTLMITSWFILLPFMQHSAKKLANDIHLTLQQWESADQQQRLTLMDQPQTYSRLHVRKMPEGDRQPSYLPYVALVNKILERDHQLTFESYYIRDTNGKVQYWNEFPNQQVGIAYQRDLFNTQPMLAMALLLTFLFGLTVLTAWFLAKQQQKLLYGLTQVSERIRHGDFSVRVQDVHSPTRETYLLGQTMNQMTEHLTELLEKRAILLAGISHDLRTPLTRLSLLQAVHEPSLPNTFNTKHRQQLEEINSLLALFMDASKTAHTQSNRRDTIDLPEFLQSLITQSSAPERISYLDQGKAYSPIHTNSLALKRAISNLLENALKYTTESVELSLQDKTESMVITVSDHGNGLPEAVKSRLGTPFIHQADEQTTSKPSESGIGLGLSIVHYLCQSQAWLIQTQSEKGQNGLCVSIEIPTRLNSVN